MKTIWFDMDGTFANLYGQDNWLEKLEKEDESVYNCLPLYNMKELNNLIKKLKKNYKIGVITWTSKKGSKEFNKRVRKVKLDWLKDKEFEFDKFHCVKYGTPKNKFMNKGDVLIDDELQNVINADKKGYGIRTNGTNLLKILETF